MDSGRLFNYTAALAFILLLFIIAIFFLDSDKLTSTEEEFVVDAQSLVGFALAYVLPMTIVIIALILGSAIVPAIMMLIGCWFVFFFVNDLELNYVTVPFLALSALIIIMALCAKVMDHGERTDIRDSIAEDMGLEEERSDSMKRYVHRESYGDAAKMDKARAKMSGTFYVRFSMQEVETVPTYEKTAEVIAQYEDGTEEHVRDEYGWVDRHELVINSKEIACSTAAEALAMARAKSYMAVDGIAVVRCVNDYLGMDVLMARFVHGQLVPVRTRQGTSIPSSQSCG